MKQQNIGKFSQAEIFVILKAVEVLVIPLVLVTSYFMGMFALTKTGVILITLGDHIGAFICGFIINVLLISSIYAWIKGNWIVAGKLTQRQ